MLVLHDDGEPEYAYGPAQWLPDTKVDNFSHALYDDANKQGWFASGIGCTLLVGITSGASFQLHLHRPKSDESLCEFFARFSSP